MNNIKRKISVFIFLILTLSTCKDNDVKHDPLDDIDLSTSFYYEINLKDRSDDTFKVKMYVSDLTEANKVYQFPATVPGVYDIFDIGRFVVEFKAFDEDHNPLGVTELSTNQWELSDPEATRTIEFEVKETFDNPPAEHSIYLMGGTSIENNCVLLNTFDVLGYPTGLKERDFYLKLNYPSGWKVGTSLKKNDNGLYYAENYDQFVDSPFLMGEVTKASTEVDDATINIVTFSKSKRISSAQILGDVNQVMLDASAFLKGLPVDRYNFLYLFENNPGGGGALEHSFSSVYTLNDIAYTPDNGQFIRDISAHEFFHIVTPLNIHSEIIEDFNFADPTASRHLWLYEGVTEWASMMMQYRNGSMSLNGLFADLKSKKNGADFYYNQNPGMSLEEMSLTCYTPAGSAQFSNVYRKGALVAAMLDIKLLELSNGEKGLRELILELINTYGPENAFSEETFFEDLVDMTYPEIENFIDLYIKGTATLPLNEYFNKIGIEVVDPSVNTNIFRSMSIQTPAQVALFNKWKVNL